MCVFNEPIRKLPILNFNEEFLLNLNLCFNSLINEINCVPSFEHCFELNEENQSIVHSKLIINYQDKPIKEIKITSRNSLTFTIAIIKLFTLYLYQKLDLTHYNVFENLLKEIFETD